jgi:cytochrome c oxidase cbb3-type subunit III
MSVFTRNLLITLSRAEFDDLLAANDSRIPRIALRQLAFKVILLRMQRFVAIPMFLAGTALISSAQTAPPKNPLGHGPEVVASGRAIFNRTCTACHGADGAEGERAPALVGDRRFFRLTESAIFDTIKNGIPGTAMPALGLPDDDIWRIVVFIRAMRASASDTDVSGNIERGAAVFAGKGGCLKCHMLQGHGGTIGPDLSNIGAQITLQHLTESLRQERPIPTGYLPVKVVTRSGETIEGIAKNEDGFSIQILDFQDKLHLYDKSELREIVHGTTSLMPHDYDKALTPGEYQDLVAMLAHQVTTKLNVKQQGEGEVGR